ncbi:MAG: hypothetical protein QXK80_01740 [Candidatus Pacearchaeota archaeon]
MKKISVFMLIILIFIFPLIINSVKADFIVTTNLTTNTVCPGSTIVIEDIVTATTPGAFTIAIGGTASSFTTTVPAGFWLEQGEKEAIYSYITPSSKVSPGNYVLEVTITQGGIVKTQKHNIIVENCHNTVLKVEPSTQTICACEQKSFSLTLSNLGNYLENYILTVEGPAKDWINLSSKEITLGSNKSTTIAAYIMTPCNVKGSYEINFVAKSKSEYAKANAKAKVDIVSCYDYSISTEKTYYDICEAEKVVIPVKIKNFGTQNNIYKINMQAPNWTVLDLKQITVEKDKEGIFNIIAQPPYKTQGNFTVFLEVMSEYGKVLKKHDIRIDVAKCYDVSVIIEEDKDKMCNALSNTYSVVIKNIGKFQNTYDIVLEAPDWVTISEKRLTLNASKEKAIVLDVHPPYNTKEGTYEIKVKAVDAISKAEASDSLNITTISLEECYKPAISTKDELIKVARDGTATVLFIVENKGTNDANYTVEISGTATKFSQINPGTIKLGAGKAQTLYLYIAPPLEQQLDDYTATVTVRLEDTTILASKTITIKVVEAGMISQPSTTPTQPQPIEEIEQEKEIKPSVFTQIISWIVNLFKAKPKPSESQQKIETTNLTNINMTETKIKNEPPILTKKIPDIIIQTGNKATINLADYFSDPNNDTLTYVTIKPSNITLTMVGNIVMIEPQKNFIGTREITFYASDGYNLAQSNLVKIIVTNESVENNNSENNKDTSQNLSTLAKNSECDEECYNSILETVNEETKTSKISSSKYAGWIVLAIIVLAIIIIILTGAGKKIIDFFEEEDTEKRKNHKNNRNK